MISHYEWFTSLGFITFDTVKCPAEQQFDDANEDTTTEEASKVKTVRILIPKMVKKLQKISTQSTVAN